MKTLIKFIAPCLIGLCLVGCNGTELEEIEQKQLTEQLLGNWYVINRDFDDKQSAIDYAMENPNCLDYSEIAYNRKTNSKNFNTLHGYHFEGNHKNLALSETSELYYTAPTTQNISGGSVATGGRITLTKRSGMYRIVVNNMVNDYSYDISLIDDNMMILRRKINGKHVFLLLFKGQPTEKRHEQLLKDCEFFWGNKWYMYKKRVKPENQPIAETTFTDNNIGFTCTGLTKKNYQTTESQLYCYDGRFTQDIGFVDLDGDYGFYACLGYFNIKIGQVYCTILAHDEESFYANCFAKNMTENVYKLQCLSDSEFVASTIKWDIDSTQIETSYYFTKTTE